jgi:hypothetical protein
MSIDHFQLTDQAIGESLSHFQLAPGEVALEMPATLTVPVCGMYINPAQLF